MSCEEGKTQCKFTTAERNSGRNTSPRGCGGHGQPHAAARARMHRNPVGWKTLAGERRGPGAESPSTGRRRRAWLAAAVVGPGHRVSGSRVSAWESAEVQRRITSLPLARACFVRYVSCFFNPIFRLLLKSWAFAKAFSTFAKKFYTLSLKNFLRMSAFREL